jgi:shikimate dehydrogenase
VTEFRLYGIFGFPLGHTLSPDMQEAAFRSLGIKAFYLPFEVRQNDFLKLLRERKHLLLDGFNITVPYKEIALRYLDGLSPEARAIGAVNSVVCRGKRWIGFNTDGTGFITSLEKGAGFRPRGKRVMILGAGGSARAVAYGLAKRRVKSITFANRTLSKARKIVSEYRRLFPRVEFAGTGLKPAPTAAWLKTVDLVVNATSVGLKAGDRPLVAAKDFPNRRALFVDLIYKPAETRFLQSARRSGHRTLNGLGMLLYQGARAFELWTGRRAPIKEMRRALQEALRRAC